MAQSKKYFAEGSFFFKLLRFLNLLEPEKPVLSLSKILVMLMMWLFVHVAIYYPDNLSAILTAGFGITASLANYGYRRHVQTKGVITEYVNAAADSTPMNNPFDGIPSATNSQPEGLEPNPD